MYKSLKAALEEHTKKSTNKLIQINFCHFFYNILSKPAWFVHHSWNSMVLTSSGLGKLQQGGQSKFIPNRTISTLSKQETGRILFRIVVQRETLAWTEFARNTLVPSSFVQARHPPPRIANPQINERPNGRVLDLEKGGCRRNPVGDCTQY